jgi:hypothetical protein
MAQVAAKVIKWQDASNSDAFGKALKVCPPDIQKNFMRITFTER